MIGPAADDAFTITIGVHEGQAAALTERLRAVNLAHLATEGARLPLEVYALEATNAVIGGLIGGTVWGWLEVGVLWVDDRWRRQGVGRALLGRAEAEAQRRGCHAARLSTWDFQAPDFYRRLGYIAYGVLDGYPAGHTVYYLRKDLTEPPPTTP